MARIPRASADAIDRLARGAHAFHRFAHHPLCDEYAGEVVRLGRRARICRGCALAALGAATGLAIGIAFPIPIGVSAIVVAAGSVLAAKPLRPAGKLASRFLPAACAGAAIASGILAAILASALLVLSVARYRRRGPDRSPCAACPERDGPSPCRGFAAIVRRERAFRRFAARRFDFENLERAGNPP